MKGVWLAIALLLVIATTEGSAYAAENERAASKAQYLVAAANPDATDAGMRILASGGTAVDAAVAIQMVLGVVEPQSSGLGGGAVALYRAAGERQPLAFDGLAKSPAPYDPNASASAGFPHSGTAVGVPGALRTLDLMHQRYGKLPWSSLFQRAIELAGTEEGARIDRWPWRRLRRRDRWTGDDREVTESSGRRRACQLDGCKPVAIGDDARSLIADRPRHYGRGDQRRKPRRFRSDEPGHRTASLASGDRPHIPVLPRPRRPIGISSAAVISGRL
jgi:hypothetical protein